MGLTHFASSRSQREESAAVSKAQSNIHRLAISVRLYFGQYVVALIHGFNGRYTVRIVQSSPR